MAQTTQFRGTARRIVTEGSVTRYFYHNTAVVSVDHHDNTFQLDNGGYMTVTTKRAMNQASAQAGLGFSVVQKDFEWFVEYRGQRHPFNNRTMTFAR